MGLVKLEKKSCDLMILNNPEAINSQSNQIEVMDSAGNIFAKIAGSKRQVADEILRIVERRLIRQAGAGDLA